MGIQGDPSIVLNSFPLPDLSIAEQNVFFTPGEITAEIDSFTVNIVVTNLARGTYQPFDITIEHNTTICVTSNGQTGWLCRSVKKANHPL